MEIAMIVLAVITLIIGAHSIGVHAGLSKEINMWAEEVFRSQETVSAANHRARNAEEVALQARDRADEAKERADEAKERAEGAGRGVSYVTQFVVDEAIRRARKEQAARQSQDSQQAAPVPASEHVSVSESEAGR